MEARTVSRSQITTNPDWLHNAHAGEMLVSEFMEPLELDAGTLAAAIDAPVAHLEAVIAGERPMDAELDLRLGRYFRMSGACRISMSCSKPSAR
jgi:addiction module HigA family antidote